MVSGVFGGTPCTGTLVRTSVNIYSGANHKTSQFINSVVVVLVVMFFMPGFVYIPMPVIAAMLMSSAFRLFPFHFMEYLYQVDKFDLAILAFTTCICMFVDGALGVIMGTFISLLRNALTTVHGEVKFEQDEDYLMVKISGNLNFISS